MVGSDRASGSGLDLQGYARYQNRSGVSMCLFTYLFLYIAKHWKIGRCKTPCGMSTLDLNF